MLPPPTLLPLETAAARIRETRKIVAKRRGPSPYFFLCGAGISVPSVPLAWQIEQECRERAERLGLASGTPPNDPAGGYSYWLEQAYPDPDQRRGYFRSKIEGRRISDANLRLAHLLSAGAVTKLLISPNFDDFASRALHLFGQAHVVCDHPATTARVDLEAEDVQIVHVHGTYWFYDLVNTDNEIEDRAKGMRSGPGMGELVTDLMRHRSPVVVGYSGWEGDVLMTALRERLARGRLRHQLYWFCYRREAIDALPGWLRTHPNACFVVPAAGSAQPADRVFDELLRVFRVEAPALTRDPLGFFAERLEGALPKRDASSPPDLYYFEDVVRRVRRAAELAEGNRREGLAAIERVRDAVRRGRYGLAARRANAIDLRSFSKELLGQLLDALWPATARGGSDASEDLRIYEAFLRVIDERPTAPVRSGRLASVLIGRVGALARQGHHRKAIAEVDAALERLDDDGSRMPRAIHRLLRLKARSLGADRRPAAALAAYELLEERFGRRATGRLRAPIFGARRERASVLCGLGRADEAQRILDDAIAKLDGGRDPALRRELVATLLTRAETRAALGQASGAERDRGAAKALGDTLPPNGAPELG